MKFVHGIYIVSTIKWHGRIASEPRWGRQRRIAPNKTDTAFDRDFSSAARRDVIDVSKRITSASHQA